MIDVKNLTQIYSSGKGIFDVNFSVKEGEVFGYLGPNGSGKTTTIRNLMGFVNSTKGQASIAGLDCRKESKKLQNTIGYLPGEMALFEYMTGMEFLKFMTNMRKTKDISRRDELIERFELETSGKIKKMSKGMKQKIGIITAFMHDPKVYILDEPTSGLDPLMQNVFLDLVKEEKKRGKTILMSSHIFEEVQRSCDRAGIIREGKLIAVNDVKSLDEIKSKMFIISLDNEDNAKKIHNSDFSTTILSENRIQVSIKYPYQDFFNMLSKYDIKGIELHHESLEDTFMKYYKEAGDLNE